MALSIREVMNRELFALRPAESLADAIGYLVALGISGAPVIEEGKPVGVVTLGDLLAPREGATVRERMTSPAVTIDAHASIADASAALAARGVHRLIVTDDTGRAVGVASALDLLRGLIGAPVAHPPAFPHIDRRTGLSWSDDQKFDLDHIMTAPAEPGLVALIHGAAGEPERVVWAEECDDVRERLAVLVSYIPDSEPPSLRNILSKPDHLRFRTAVAKSAKTRTRALKKVLDDAARVRLTPAPAR